jgi:probable HAF family extracellular repeat protein
MQNLNDLIPSNSGWSLSLPTGINSRGQITGQGTINGEQHAFLLTPVAK